jgi:hypothetical protein
MRRALDVACCVAPLNIAVYFNSHRVSTSPESDPDSVAILHAARGAGAAAEDGQASAHAPASSEGRADATKSSRRAGCDWADYLQLLWRPEEPVLLTRPSDGWAVGVSATARPQPESVSFVNGVSTYRGGTHVNFVAGQVCKAVWEKLQSSPRLKQDFAGVTVILFCHGHRPRAG